MFKQSEKPVTFYCDACGKAIKDDNFNVVFCGSINMKDCSENFTEAKILHKGDCDDRQFKDLGWMEGRDMRKDPINILLNLQMSFGTIIKEDWMDIFKRLTIDGYEKLRHKYKSKAGQLLKDKYGECHYQTSESVKEALKDKLEISPTIKKMAGACTSGNIKCDTYSLSLSMNNGRSFDYSIPWYRLSTVVDMMDWIHQLHEKTWVTKELLCEFIHVASVYVKVADTEKYDSCTFDVSDLVKLVDSDPEYPGFVTRLGHLCHENNIKQPWC